MYFLPIDPRNQMKAETPTEQATMPPHGSHVVVVVVVIIIIIINVSHFAVLYSTCPLLVNSPRLVSKFFQIWYVFSHNEQWHCGKAGSISGNECDRTVQKMVLIKLWVNNPHSLPIEAVGFL